MTLRELLTELTHLSLKEGFDLDQEVVIGHYNQQRELVGDLDLMEVDWLFLSAEDDDKPNYKRTKVVELACYEQATTNTPGEKVSYYDN